MSRLSRDILDNAAAILAAGMCDEARAMLQAFAGPEPPQPGPGDNAMLYWHDAAEVISEAGMAEAAEKAWQRAQAAGLADYVAETGSIVGWVIAGQFDNLVQRVTDLAMSHPRNPAIANLHALVLFETGEHALALEKWAKCRHISAQKDCPLSTHPLYLAMSAIALERFLLKSHAALNAADPAVTAAPQRAPGFTSRSRLARIEKALEQGNVEQALEWIEAESQGKEMSDHEQFGMLRAIALGEAAQWGAAREELAAVLEQPGISPAAQSYFAYCLVQSGEPSAALEILDRVYPAGPDDYFANYFRGCANLALGYRTESLQAFKKSFNDYFFDSYHCILLPTWEKVVRLVGKAQ